MTKKHPVPYFVKKTLSQSANAKPWAKGGKASTAREELLEAIKLRLLAKKKKK